MHIVKDNKTYKAIKQASFSDFILYIRKTPYKRKLPIREKKGATNFSLTRSFDCTFVREAVYRNMRSVTLCLQGMYYLRSKKVGTLDWPRPFPADASSTSRANEGPALSAQPAGHGPWLN